MYPCFHRVTSLRFTELQTMIYNFPKIVNYNYDYNYDLRKQVNIITILITVIVHRKVNYNYNYNHFHIFTNYLVIIKFIFD